ncbi:MAG TPA: lactonase family protein [Sphingomonas sp.]|jgi:6-phosphogluconolactonase|nr:lactonase family protein [Sphingomonas sp.]
MSDILSTRSLRDPVGRRDVVGMVAAAGAAAPLAAPLAGALPGPPTRHLVVGTYAAEHGAGLCPLFYDVGRDRWSAGTPVPTIANASFGAYNPRHGLFYLLDERQDGSVGAYRPDDWRQLGAWTSGGADPCHIALDPRQRQLAVANYANGSIALYAVDPATGGLREPARISITPGKGPNAERQSGPHAHWVGFAPDGRWLHMVDLGADIVLGFDLRSGGRTPIVSYRAPPGTGPRHMAFHPRLPVAYLVSELVSQVTVLEAAGFGRFRATQSATTLPDGGSSPNFPAEVAINRAGNRLYVSNRGHNSIAVFAVSGDGRLRLLEHVPTGNWPRFFLMCEDAGRLFVANQRAGTVQAFALRPDGRLRPTAASIAVPGAAFIARVPAGHKVS